MIKNLIYLAISIVCVLAGSNKTLSINRETKSFTIL